MTRALPEEILAHYGQEIDEGRRITDGLRQLELVRTQEVVRRHLPRGALRILDVGGDTGVHASWLAAEGHRVHLVDPVAAQVRRALATPAARSGQVTAEMGDARHLGQEDASFDAALALGPLYHLTHHDDRLAALGEARRVVRPGGLIFAGAISRFASLFDGLARAFIFDPRFASIVEKDLATGQHRNPERQPHWFTTAYFHHPDELEREVGEAGLALRELVGLEGLAAFLGHLEEQWRDLAGREVILTSARAVETEPSLRGLSPHLLAVADRI